jgi:hypothetical protein
VLDVAVSQLYSSAMIGNGVSEASGSAVYRSSDIELFPSQNYKIKTTDSMQTDHLILHKSNSHSSGENLGRAKGNLEVNMGFVDF